MTEQKIKTYRWKTTKVFISSTFRDFHAERDYLIKYVFPDLRLWCEKYKLHLVDIDLRWGVTTAETGLEKFKLKSDQSINQQMYVFTGWQTNSYN